MNEFPLCGTDILGGQIFANNTYNITPQVVNTTFKLSKLLSPAILNNVYLVCSPINLIHKLKVKSEINK